MIWYIWDSLSGLGERSCVLPETEGGTFLMHSVLNWVHREEEKKRQTWPLGHRLSIFHMEHRYRNISRKTHNFRKWPEWCLDRSIQQKVFKSTSEAHFVLFAVAFQPLRWVGDCVAVTCLSGRRRPSDGLFCSANCDSAKPPSVSLLLSAHWSSLPFPLLQSYYRCFIGNRLCSVCQLQVATEALEEHDSRKMGKRRRRHWKPSKQACSHELLLTLRLSDSISCLNILSGFLALYLLEDFRSLFQKYYQTSKFEAIMSLFSATLEIDRLGVSLIRGLRCFHCSALNDSQISLPCAGDLSPDLSSSFDTFMDVLRRGHHFSIQTFQVHSSPNTAVFLLTDNNWT